MTFARKKLGTAGEDLAAQFLLKLGYRILARNLKNRYGEIDLLAVDGATLVIVEVKAKSNTVYGTAAEMVNRPKQQKLKLLAVAVAQQYRMLDYRIDVIAIDAASSANPTIEHYINAVS
jgi:putative endonuclease